MNEFGLVQAEAAAATDRAKWCHRKSSLARTPRSKGKMYVRFADSKDVYIAAQTVRTDIAKKAG